MTSSIIVAPHSDDAILSLGGRLLANPEQEKFTVLNLFSTCAFTIIPGLTDTSEITRINNLEESQALGSISIPLEFMYLPEVLLRGYERWNASPQYSRDEEIKKTIASRIRSLAKEADRFYFPLAIGNHTDHRLTTQTAKELLEEGIFDKRELFFYEDLPYSFETCGVEERLARVRTILKRELEEKVLDISEQVERKIELVQVYRSQYDSAYARRIKEYAEKLAGKKGKFCERSWRLKWD